MKFYDNADDIKADLKEETQSYEQSLEQPYMKVLWNICYQLARIADKFSPGFRDSTG